VLFGFFGRETFFESGEMGDAAGVITRFEFRDSEIVMEVRPGDGLAVGGEEGDVFSVVVVVTVVTLAGEADEFLPLFETDEGVAETLASVLPTAAVGIVDGFPLFFRE